MGRAVGEVLQHGEQEVSTMKGRRGFSMVEWLIMFALMIGVFLIGLPKFFKPEANKAIQSAGEVVSGSVDKFKEAALK